MLSIKITFLCGSLEPGRDGVGDYTRRLGCELIRQGNQVTLIALFDPYVSTEIISEQYFEDVGLSILRIPHKWPSKSRFKRAKVWIDEFCPQWLSLQFVPFAFHFKGLPFDLENGLASLGKGRCWHIMFHELWLGSYVQSSPYHVLIGWMQQQLVKSLSKRLKPAVMHTQCRLYQAMLAKTGITAMFLSLFSNIPIAQTNTALENADTSLISKNIYLVVFGTIHPHAPIDELASEMALYASCNGIRFFFTFIGRCGSELEKWTAILQSKGLSVRSLGEQCPENVSEELFKASLGISTTAFIMIEKSGTVAAMQEHGLPILCVSHDLRSKSIKRFASPDGIIEYRKGIIDECFTSLRKSSGGSRISTVSRQMANALLAAL